MTTALLAGCFFDADYGGGTGLTCTDGHCPDGLACRADLTCGPPIDAAPPDMLMIDAREAALTCADPGEVPAAGGAVSGTTTGRATNISSMCGGFVMNGRDAVYRIDLPAAASVTVTITGARKVYAVATCAAPPATPACLGNVAGTAAAPLVVSAPVGATFLVVDDENPANAGAYGLAIAVN